MGVLRAGGNAGLKLPICTLPLSEMTADCFFVAAQVIFTLAIGSSYIQSGNIAQTLHVGRESMAFVKNNPCIKHNRSRSP
jgi:hypothetical protein